MKKIFICLFIFFIGFSKLFSINLLDLIKQYPFEVELLFCQKGLKEVKEYTNGELDFSAKLKSINKVEKIFNFTGDMTYYKSLIISDNNNVLSIKGINDKGNVEKKIEYYKDGNKIIKKYVETFTYEDYDDSNKIKSRIIPETFTYEYKGDRLISIKNESISRKYFYNEKNLIDKIRYETDEFLPDQSLYVEKYRYSDDNNYIVAPCYEFLLLKMREIDRKQHYEKKENNEQIIVNEYYINDRIYHKREIHLICSKVKKYIINFNALNEIVEYQFYY